MYSYVMDEYASMCGKESFATVAVERRDAWEKGERSVRALMVSS